MDVAGDSATKRGIHLAQDQGFNIKVVTLPRGLDPADVVLKESENFGNYLEAAKSIYDFYFDTTFAKFNKDTSDGKRDISKALLPVLKEIPNRIVQVHWIGELAKKLGVKSEDVETELAKINIRPPDFEDRNAVQSVAPAPLAMTRKNMLEERLGVLALKHPKAALVGFASFAQSDKNIVFNQKDFTVNFPAESGRQAFFMNLVDNAGIRDILTMITENPETDFKNNAIGDTNTFNVLALGADIEEIEEKDAAQESCNCLKEIFCIEIKKKLDDISQTLRRAESNRNSEETEKLMQEFNYCSKSLHNLTR